MIRFIISSIVPSRTIFCRGALKRMRSSLQNVLLQILDDGRITDAHGKTVNFENTILVMTTNAGSDSAGALAGFSTNEKAGSEQRTEKALSSFLRPEFLNRVDEIVTFRALSEEDFVKIAAIMMKETTTALLEHGIALTVTDDALALIAKRSYSRKFGARQMRRFIQEHVEDALAEKIIADYARQLSVAKVFVKGGEIAVEAL